MANFNFLEGEILLFDKPYGWTSFELVRKVRNIIKKFCQRKGEKIKVGHAGTLDPLATGLLIVCTGKLTKKIVEFQALVKEYIGTMRIDATTPSFDMETNITQTYDISHITEDLIERAKKKFIGEIEQIPPIFSAKKISGVRAYKKARQSEIFNLNSVKVYIYDFEITKINLPEVEFKIVCSKGTYIRSIARDFGKELNAGGFLTSLCRTRIGNYSLKNAMKIEEFREMLYQR